MRFEKTQRTPLVEMSDSHCLIVGECYPENISEWSQPVLSALEVCVGAKDSFDVDIELYYFNSSSAKFLFDFFEFLDEKAENGIRIAINWRYRPEDDTMQEAGEDFEEDIENCTYNLVEKGVPLQPTWAQVSTGLPQGTCIIHVADSAAILSGARATTSASSFNQLANQPYD